jgi:ParB/RepB/Spo0J family partition protein
MEQSEVKNLSVDEIIEPKENIRSSMTREYLDELADSISRVGIIQPLIVTPKGEKFEIVAGCRRYLAARQAGLIVLPCIVSNLDERGSDLARVHENLFREDPSPIDEARYYAMLCEKYNYDISSIANAVSRSVAYVEGRLEILKFPEDVLAALSANVVSLSVAREFAKIPDPDKRYYFLNLAAANGITTETARNWRFSYEIEKGQRPPLSSDQGTQAFPPSPVELKVKCEGCQESVDLKDSRVMYLCVKCHDAIKRILETPPEK